MYKRHKILLFFLSITVFVLSFIFKADYSLVSELVVTIISIALAVYIAAASVLLGSPFSKELKRQIDKEDKTKSLLGVLSVYLRKAGAYSIVSIIISCLYSISPSISVPFSIESIQHIFVYRDLFVNIFSSISCTLFSANIFFLWQILKFIIFSLTKAAD